MPLQHTAFTWVGVGRNKTFRAQARISVSGTRSRVPETPPRATPFDKLRTGLGGLIPAYACS
ncbi:MAG: hypothetical protein QX196_08270 [Methylococcaceae bacterium]